MSPVQAIGKFYDGLSGASHEVMIGLSGSGLRITCTDNTFEKSWSYNEIQVLEDASAPQPAKLTSTREPETRLLINPDTGWLRIRDKLPKSAFPSVSLPISWVSFIGYGGLALAVILFIVFSAPAMLEYGAYLISTSAQESLGRYVMSYKEVCTAPEGRAALDKMTERLAQTSTRDITYRVEVIENDAMMNALAAPGGYLTLFSGIIKEADSPEEIAGVLAHEMAHIELRHPTRGLVRDLGLSVLIGMMTGGSDMAKLAGDLSTLRYSRHDEEEADEKGQDILAQAHLDPASMSLFFERLLEEEELGEETSIPGWLSYLSTHPQTASRIENIKNRTVKASQVKPLLSAREWQDLKNICSETAQYK